MNNIMYQKYCEELLKADFLEATKVSGNFYKETKDFVSFIVNLKAMENGIEICYGFASTAFARFAGDEHALVEYGVDNDSCNLRYFALISNETEENEIKQYISEIYQKYCNVEKDELLAIAKEKRKGFLQQIGAKLKPLGFKKKAATWTRFITDTYYIKFNAQKSLYSDEYYFNVYISRTGTDSHGECYYTRVAPNDQCPADWQLLSYDDMQKFLDDTVEHTLLPLINTPLEELGKQPYIWDQCCCSRDICDHCWVEKNLWEAKDTSEE